jgi:molecular chaperone HscB
MSAGPVSAAGPALADDDFVLFGFERRFALDGAELDERWRRLQASVHPDRFAAEGASAQRVAMQWSMRLNEAHRRLKDPLRRAALLCELAGVPIDAERHTAMPAAFLVQQMQWREALEEAPDAAAAEAIERDLDRAEGARVAAVADAIDARRDFTSAAVEVRAWMFLRRFRDDVERRLDALSPAR